MRKIWAEEFARRERLTLLPEVDGKPLFEHHFAYADKLAAGQAFDSAAAERQVRETLTRFLRPAS